MSAIQLSQRTAYRAPTRGRTYLTPRSAARAEAAAMLDKKYPAEKPEYENGMCYYTGYHWSSDERLQKAYARLAKRILSALRQSIRTQGATP